MCDYTEPFWKNYINNHAKYKRKMVFKYRPNGQGFGNAISGLPMALFLGTFFTIIRHIFIL